MTHDPDRLCFVHQLPQMREYQINFSFPDVFSIYRYVPSSKVHNLYLIFDLHDTHKSGLSLVTPVRPYPTRKPSFPITRPGPFENQVNDVPGKLIVRFYLDPSFRKGTRNSPSVFLLSSRTQYNSRLKRKNFSQLIPLTHIGRPQSEDPFHVLI